MNWMMAAALIIAVWVCLPDVLFLLGLTRVRRGILGGPEAVRSGPGEVVTDEIAEQLDALGFVPAGLYWEQLPAHKLFRHPVFVYCSVVLGEIGVSDDRSESFRRVLGQPTRGNLANSSCGVGERASHPLLRISTSVSAGQDK
jgi:hypothetical protein